MATATPLRLSPLHAATGALKAQYTPAGGWQVPEHYSSVDAELAAARAGAAVADISAQGKLYVEGAAAAAALHGAFGQAPNAAGAGVRVSGHSLFCLRPDYFFVLTAVGAEAEAQAKLLAAVPAGALVTVTDMTHGLAGILLAGPRARAVLSQLSALDFGEAAFPNLSLRATSLAKVKHLIVRQDRGGLPAFSLFGPQSLSAYVWDVIQTAGHAEHLQPLGLTAAVALEG